jgi:hypothetical protein
MLRLRRKKRYNKSMDQFLSELNRTERNQLARLVRLYHAGELDSKGRDDVEFLIGADPLTHYLSRTRLQAIQRREMEFKKIGALQKAINFCRKAPIFSL